MQSDEQCISNKTDRKNNNFSWFMELNDDEKYMERALQLASLGRGRVSPNPMVGAVVVARGRIVAGFVQGMQQIEVDVVHAQPLELLLEDVHPDTAAECISGCYG